VLNLNPNPTPDPNPFPNPEQVFAPCSKIAGGNTNWIGKKDEEIIDATMGELTLSLTLTPTLTPTPTLTLTPR